MGGYAAVPPPAGRATGICVPPAAGGAQDKLERIVHCAREAVLRDRAEVVLLASGGLTGLAPVLAEAIHRPVVDGVVAAVTLAVAKVGAQNC